MMGHMIDPNNASQTAVALSGDVVPSHGYLSWAATGVAVYGATIVLYGLVALAVLRITRQIRELSAAADELRRAAEDLSAEIRRDLRRGS